MAKILVVDDVQNEAMQLAFDLEQMGHEVLGASSGEEALNVAAAESPDAIFLDAVMPEMDGIEVCRRLKDDSQLESIAVILMTANDLDKDIVKGLDAGADDYIRKSCAKEMLVVRLHSVLRTLNDRKAIVQLDEQLQEEIARRKQGEQSQAELLSSTFSASIQMLVDFAELLQPDCIGLTLRVHATVKDICTEMKMTNPWEVDVATMLSNVGCVKMPPEILTKVCDGQELSFSEKRVFWKHPQIAADIIKRIPRMQRVARIVEYQERCYNGDGPPFDDRITRGKEIPLGARILKLALAFDAQIMSGSTNHEAIEVIRTHAALYDPELVELLGQRVIREPEYEVRSLMIKQLRAGMVLSEHILSRDDSVLIRNGRTVTAATLRNLNRYCDVGSFDDRVREPIRVRVPVYRDPPPEQPEDQPEEKESQHEGATT